MNVAAVVDQAVYLKRNGDYDQAISLLTDVIRSTNDINETIMAKNSLGKCYNIIGEHEKAKTTFLSMAKVVMQFCTDAPQSGVTLGPGMKLSKDDFTRQNGSFILDYAHHMGAAILNNELSDHSAYLYSIGRHHGYTPGVVSPVNKAKRISAGLKYMENMMDLSSSHEYSIIKDNIKNMLASNLSKGEQITIFGL